MRRLIYKKYNQKVKYTEPFYQRIQKCHYSSVVVLNILSIIQEHE